MTGVKSLAGKGGHPGAEHPIGIGLPGLHDAVCGCEDRPGELGELSLLLLPGSPEVAHEVRELAQLGIHVCGEHLAVGVYVHALASCL